VILEWTSGKKEARRKKIALGARKGATYYKTEEPSDDLSPRMGEKGMLRIGITRNFLIDAEPVKNRDGRGAPQSFRGDEAILIRSIIKDVRSTAGEERKKNSTNMHC